MKTKTIGLYLTRTGKEGIRLNEYTASNGKVSYGWTGEYGAGSGKSLEEYIEEFDGILRRKKGVSVEMDPRNHASQTGA